MSWYHDDQNQCDVFKQVALVNALYAVNIECPAIPNF
jgi:hypothetical protein